MSRCSMCLHETDTSGRCRNMACPTNLPKYTTSVQGLHGWICPVCHTGVSPFSTICPGCIPTPKTTLSVTTQPAPGHNGDEERKICQALSHVDYGVWDNGNLLVSCPRGFATCLEIARSFARPDLVTAISSILYSKKARHPLSKVNTTKAWWRMADGSVVAAAAYDLGGWQFAMERLITLKKIEKGNWIPPERLLLADEAESVEE